VDFESDGWAKTCARVKPNVEDDAAMLEVRKLRDEVAELKSLLLEMNQSLRKGQIEGTSSGEGQGEDNEPTQVDDTDENEQSGSK
jgi:hypothetical protein